MNTVKPLNGSNLRRSRRKRFRFWIKSYLPAILLSALLGTYLDLFMIGKGLYHFPYRPFQDIFSLNIFFTLTVLPVLMAIFLIWMSRLNIWQRGCLIILLSLVMSVCEKLAEDIGIFVHSARWSHLFTLIGYCLFLKMIHAFHKWFNEDRPG